MDLNLVLRTRLLRVGLVLLPVLGYAFITPLLAQDLPRPSTEVKKEPKKNPGPSLPTFLLDADANCTVTIDGGKPGVKVQAGEPRKVRVSNGEHLVRAVSDDGRLRWEGTVEAKSQQVVVKIALLGSPSPADVGSEGRGGAGPVTRGAAPETSPANPNAPISVGPDFTGSWAGQAVEQSPEGQIQYEVNILLQRGSANDYRCTFGGRARVAAPQGPTDVVITGDGVTAEVQADGALVVVVNRLVTTVLATGQREVQGGNAYRVTMNGSRLEGTDRSGTVRLSLQRQTTGNAPGPAASDFTGSWTGRAVEQSPEGQIQYEVNILLQREAGTTYRCTFGGKARVATPVGPADVIITGDGVNAEVQSDGSLIVVVNRLVTTVLATGQREAKEGNTYRVTLNGGRLEGTDRSGTVRLSLERQASGGASAPTPSTTTARPEPAPATFGPPRVFFAIHEHGALLQMNNDFSCGGELTIAPGRVEFSTSYAGDSFFSACPEVEFSSTGRDKVRIKVNNRTYNFLKVRALESSVADAVKNPAAILRDAVAQACGR